MQSKRERERVRDRNQIQWWRGSRTKIVNVDEKREQRKLQNKHPKIVPAVILLLIVKARECAKASSTNTQTHTHTRMYSTHPHHNRVESNILTWNTHFVNIEVEFFFLRVSFFSLQSCCLKKISRECVCVVHNKHVAYSLALKVNHHLLFFSLFLWLHCLPIGVFIFLVVDRFILWQIQKKKKSIQIVKDFDLKLVFVSLSSCAVGISVRCIQQMEKWNK